MKIYAAIKRSICVYIYVTHCATSLFTSDLACLEISTNIYVYVHIYEDFVYVGNIDILDLKLKNKVE